MGVANFRSIANYQFKFQRGYYPIGISETEIYLPFWTKLTSNQDQNWPRSNSIVKNGLCVWKAAIIIFLFCAEA